MTVVTKGLRCNIGFLDSSTSNIILDAVLTDLGRQFLSRNDGSFSIHKFAFSDDEVNYNVIPKYGRTIGKEKIEQNTPVFEALTTPSTALKYKLMSFSNPNLTRLPSISLTAGNTSGQTNVVSLGRNVTQTISLTFEQSVSGESRIDNELQDQSFIIDVPNLFLQIQGQTPENVDGQQRATYIIPRTGQNSTSGAVVTFVLAVKSISDSLFSVYGTTADRTIIKTYVKVTGMNSGAVLDVTVNVSQTS